jgi:hypothetical protein
MGRNWSRAKLLAGVSIPAFVVLALGASYAWAVSTYGSLAAVRQLLDGKSLFVEPVDYPAQAGGTVSIPVRNLSDAPQVLYGADTGCGCIATDAFPITLAPHSITSIEFRLSKTAAPGRHAILLLSEQEQSPAAMFVTTL